MEKITAVRLSKADRQTLGLAARLTGRSFSEYVREVSVLVAVNFINELGKADRLPSEHKKLLDLGFESVVLGNVVAFEKTRKKA